MLEDFLRSGLSFRSYCVTDPQSDKEASSRLNPGLLQGQWSDGGMSLAILLDCLMMSAWAGSASLSRAEVALNSFTCYYWVCINLADSRDKNTDFLPVQTAKSICELCGHAILGCWKWSKEAAFAPCYREEMIMESLFSKMKKPFRGSPSLKDAIHGCSACHLEQWRNCPPKVDDSKTCSSALEMSELSKIAKQGLRDAVDMQAFVSIDRTPSAVLKDFSSWWSKEGQKLLTSDLGPSSAEIDEEALWAVEMDVTLTDVPPTDIAPPPAEDVDSASTLLAAEDRVALMHEVADCAERGWLFWFGNVILLL